MDQRATTHGRRESIDCKRRMSENDATESNKPRNEEEEEEDDEFKITKPIPSDSSLTESDIAFYYSRLFPYRLLVNWLTYSHDCRRAATLCNDPQFFQRREISFSCKKPDGSEMYIRWQSFDDHEALRQEVFRLKPHKLDIGAVYSTPVGARGSSAKTFKPEQKEIVIDIDMDDYNDIRTCCKDKVVCSKCWKFITLAMKLLRKALNEDFGFTDILWVFSGRRGLHCWVCDSRARMLPSDARGAVADYLNLITGSGNQVKKVFFRGSRCHPMIERAFRICMQHFPILLEEQDFFNPNGAHMATVIGYLPDTGLRKENVRAEFTKFLEEKKHTGSSKDVWLQLRLLGRVSVDEMNWKQAPTAEECEKADKWLKELVIAFSYPRLDINVSKDIGHLLKSPFCVHHSTGRVCVPIDPANVDSFDPMLVPTIGLLRKQYDNMKATGEGTCRATDAFKTSLGSYLKYFEHKFLKPLNEKMKEEQKYASDIMGCVEW
eukprot:GHVS01005520.1.p1 GENE.GHVS01005520.1~~GHVS01005520.1.p1  ORF type:complete len:491 (+),score=69.18 GHVS01005520.1:55-1527(+)